jgi:sarcosine oxidase subunit beta
MRTIAADVAIIGGGIAGASAALALARRGRRAVVLERWVIGAEASGRNGGGVRQQGRLAPEIPLARCAVEMWTRMDTGLRRATGYRQTGHVYVAESAAEMEALAEQRARERQLGLETELIGPQELRRLAPGISEGLTGAKYCPTDGMADPAQATLAIAQAAEEAGATLLCHHPVTAIGQSNGRVTYVQTPELRVEAPVVLDAAGPWAPSVAQLVDVYLPIYPSRLASLRTMPLPLQTVPFVQTYAYDFGGSQLPDGSMRFGSGANRDDTNRFTFDRRFRDSELVISAKARLIFPALEQAKLSGGWAGIRECTPDMMPILGPTGGPEGFLVCAGFSGHGFCLGPCAGALMAEWITEGAPSMDLDAFSWQRFMRQEGPLSVIKMEIEQTG